MVCLRLSYVVAALVTVLAYPAALILPNWTAWENQPIENAGVIALLAGALMAFIYQHRTADRQWKWLWRSVAAIWLILFARELSWGAAFYPPTQMTGHGPIFSSDELWYKPVVYPIVAAIVLAVCLIIVRHRLWEKTNSLFRSKAMPWLELVLAAVCLVLATIAEGHLGSLARGMGDSSLALEEIMEMAAALWLFSGQMRLRLFQYAESRAAI